MKSTDSSRPGDKRRSASSSKAKSLVRAGLAEPRAPFPIVGVGASAGGLEAFEQFFRNVPKQCGAAFVVVQHLDPTHEGMLAELLQRVTSMSVGEIIDGATVAPDHVYVIPPNKDLSVTQGVLHLLEPQRRRGLRLPIDFFLTSLAADQGVQAAGVILSGMGSDGKLGLLAIRHKGGATFAQEPASAKFDSMPQAIVNSGLADIVAPASELAQLLLGHFQKRSAPSPASPTSDIQRQDEGALSKVLVLLRAHTGQDFSLYKKSTIWRRVERRLGLHGLGDASDYVRYLAENPSESQLLLKELLIGVTSFFRDPAAWQQLRDEAIPDLLAAQAGGGTLRAWSVGCSSGEEAFSLAIVLKEALQEFGSSSPLSFQVFATDLDNDAIAKARTGLYPGSISADVSPARLQAFFSRQEDGSYRINKEIRESVVFAQQNLVMHPPFTRLDIVTCRNLLIYLDTELQQKLFPLFYFSLNAHGVLLLGSSETIAGATDLFARLPGDARLYRRLDGARQGPLTQFPFAFTRSRADGPALPAAAEPKAPSLQSLADSVLLQRHGPAAVLVTKEGDILYLSGKTGAYLEPAMGKADWNLFAMCREGLGTALSEAFHKAVRQKTQVTLNHVRVDGKDRGQLVNVTVDPLHEPPALQGMLMVVFEKVPNPPALPAASLLAEPSSDNSRLLELAEELHRARTDLQAARDEMQTSREELHSTNEELQSMNEELQSTNEELTTSKEESQSVNEELQTVNQEMQAKVDQLSNTGNDMKNLLDSTDIAILFLDSALCVRRFTPPTAKIIRLIPTDIGRQITDLVSALEYPSMAADARQVLRSLVSVEREVITRDQRWFTVRIMPYRTHDSRVDGLVITLADITPGKLLEAALRKAQSKLQARFTRQGERKMKAKPKARPMPVAAAKRVRPSTLKSTDSAKNAGRRSR